MDKNEVTETKYRFTHHWGRRLLAFFLAVVLLGSMMLAWAAQIRDLGMQYVGTTLEQAQRVMQSNTGYLNQPMLERAWRILKTLVPKPRGYDDYDTYASLAIARGDYATAADFMQGCIDTYAGDSDGEKAMLWLRKGSLYTLCEDYDNAIACYDKTLELNSNVADAYLLRAQMQNERGKTEQAVADLREYQRLNGGSQTIQAVMGSMYEAAGEYAAAVECYTQAMQGENYDISILASRGRCKILTGDALGAKSDLERYFSAGGEDGNGDINAMLGMCRMEANDYAGALESLHKAADLNYQNPQLLYSQSAACAFAIDDFETAIADGEKAIALGQAQRMTAGELSEAWKWVGYSHFSRSEFPEAAEALSQALAGNPGLEFANYYAGICYMSAEQPEKAVAYFEASAARKEHASICLYDSALCLLQMEQIPEAAKALLASIEANDDEKAVAGSKEILNSLAELLKTTED